MISVVLVPLYLFYVGISFCYHMVRAKRQSSEENSYHGVNNDITMQCIVTVLICYALTIHYTFTFEENKTLVGEDI